MQNLLLRKKKNLLKKLRHGSDSLRKKGKKKRERKRGTDTDSFFTLPIELLNFFSLIGIKVPTKAEELADAIAELHKKREYFNGLEAEPEEENPEEKEEEPAEEKPKEEKKKVKEETKHNELKSTDFPEPLESQVRVEYGIFKDEGPSLKREEQPKPTRGKSSWKRGGN